MEALAPLVIWAASRDHVVNDGTHGAAHSSVNGRFGASVRCVAVAGSGGVAGACEAWQPTVHSPLQRRMPLKRVAMMRGRRWSQSGEVGASIIRASAPELYALPAGFVQRQSLRGLAVPDDTEAARYSTDARNAHRVPSRIGAKKPAANSRYQSRAAGTAV